MDNEPNDAAPDTRDFATRQFVKVIRTLGAQHGFARGWQSRVADQLGIDRAYVSQLLTGKRRRVGTEAVGKAIERLKISPAWFTDPKGDLGDLVAERLFGAGGVDERAAALEGHLGSDGWAGVAASAYESISHAIRFRNHRVEAENIARAVWQHPMHRVFTAAERLRAAAARPETSDADLLKEMRGVADLADEFAAEEAPERSR